MNVGKNDAVRILKWFIEVNDVLGSVIPPLTCDSTTCVEINHKFIDSG